MRGPAEGQRQSVPDTGAQTGRRVALISGVAVAALAMGADLAGLGHDVFVVQVVQDLMLMIVAPVLLVLGAPRCVVSIPGALAHPATVWALFYGTMFGYFITPVYAFSIAHPLLNDYVGLQFLASGALYWASMDGNHRVGRQFPHAVGLMSLATGIPVSVLIGLSLITTKVSISPANTLADVHLGAAVLWVAGSVAFTAAFTLVFVQWYRQEERGGHGVESSADEAASYRAELAAHRARMAATHEGAGGPR